MHPVRLKIIRDKTMKPGSETRYADDEGVVWVVSAAGVTEEGARAFEGCTNYLAERFGWDDQVAADAAWSYEQCPDLPEDVPLRMTYRDGTLTTRLNPAHFCLATINAAKVELRESLRDRREFVIAK